MSVPSGIDLAFNSSPELVNTPGTALDVAGTLDPTTFAPVVSHAQDVQNTLTAVGSDADPGKKVLAEGDYSGGGGLFGAISHTFQSIPGIKGVEHAVGIGIHYLSAPIREIQRDYRFVHMTWTKNGPVAGLLATLGVTAGAAAGAFLGGGAGALAGGELAAFGERLGASQGLLGNYLAKTAALSADPHVKISLGRDFANALGQVPGLHTLSNTDKGFGKVVSGATDAGADWFADPVVVLSKVQTGLKLGEFGNATRAAARAHLDSSAAEAATRGTAFKITNAIQRVQSGDLLRTMQRQGVADFLDKAAPGIQIRFGGGSLAANSEQLNNLYAAQFAGASYRRALTHIAGLDSAEIATKYPELQDLAANHIKAPGVTGMPGLGSAKTAEEAHQVLVNALENAHFADRLKSLSVAPTRTLTRTPFSKLNQFVQNIDKNAATVTDEGGAVTRAVPRQGLTGATLTAAKSVAGGDLAGAKDAITGAIARKVTTFSGQQPYALDPATLKLSTQEFSVDDLTQRLSPLAGKGLYNMFRFSMGNPRARYWVDQFINADSLAEQKRIFAEAKVEFLKAAGAPEEAIGQARKDAADAMASQEDVPGGIGGGDGAYGFGKELGSDVDKTPAGDGEVKAALFNFQTSHKFRFADFQTIKQIQRGAPDGSGLMKTLQGALKVNYGRFDDMMARNYIGRFFKPLALVNAGFALRVAMAEGIGQIAREGGLQFLRDQVGAKAARMNFNLLSDEPDHILAAAAHALGAPEGSGFSLVNGINRLMNDPISRERALSLIMKRNGHIAYGLARTGEDSGGGIFDQGPSDKAKQATYYAKSYYKRDPRIKWKGADDFDYFSNDNRNWDGYWHAALTQHAQDPGVRAIAGDLLAGGKTQAEQAEAKRLQDAIDGSPDAIPFYVSQNQRLRASANIQARNQTVQDFARKRVDAVRGLTEGADDTVHSDFLDALSHGRAPTLPEVAATPLESRPAQVFGPNAAPYLGGNILDRVISYGFGHVVDPVINGLSRDPIYLNSFNKEMDTLQPAVDAGRLDADTAERIAETRSIQGMIPKIHNTALKSQFAVLARNFMPFYFAQEQAIRRVAHLVATNPGAARQYMLLQQGLNDPGFVHTDDQGHKYFIFPHIGPLQDATNGMLGLFGDQVQTGLPLTVQGNMTSLKTIAPDFNMPGVSPMVSIPLNKLTDLFPELSPDVKAITGGAGFGQSAFDALVPNTTAKAAWRVMNPSEKDATYANALFTSMMTSFYEGSAPGPNASTTEKAAWVNRLKNNARSTFIAKALVGLVSPLAPSVSNTTEQEQQFKPEFYNLVKKDGYAQALQTFLKEHGTKAISYTIAESQPAINGAYLPYTNQAINYINSPEGQQLLNSKYQAAGAFLTPQAQGKGDVQTIHAELIRNHLRTVDTPKDFLDAIDIALGNNSIQPDLKAHEAAQASFANDPRGLAAENANWSDYVHTQQLNNPTWYDYWTSPERTNLAYETYNQLHTLFSGNAQDSAGGAIPIPTGRQADIVTTLINDYISHAQAMATLGTAKQRQAERLSWKGYLDDQAKDPLKYSVINAVFARLDASGLTPSGATI